MHSPSKQHVRPPWFEVSGAPRLGIVGGRGQMGTLFHRFFEDHGFEVRIVDLETDLKVPELAGWADILVFSVPLRSSAQLIEEALPFTRDGQLLMDLTSLKAEPVEVMLRSPCDVIGLHPMFGPPLVSFERQTVIFCDARGEHGALIERLLLSAGMRVKHSEPAEHDRMMSIIQVLVHLHTISLGRTLRELGVDIGETLGWTSPVYRLELTMVGRLFAQDPALYAAIEELNPHAAEVVAEARRSISFYADVVERGDFDAFIEDFEQTADFLGDFRLDAQLLSKMLIRHLP